MGPEPENDAITTIVRSVRAPDALRARIAAETDRTLVRRTIVKRMKLSGALAAAAACLGIVVGLASLGGSDDPSALAAANLATRGAVAAAPAVDPANGKVLTARVDNVSFPVWADRFPWKAKGIRTDELEGRKTTTVFYDDPQGVRLGYTIVAGEALDWPQDSRRVVRNGIEVRTTTQDGRIVAFWREHGHTCVISAPDTVPEDRMITLASSGYV